MFLDGIRKESTRTVLPAPFTRIYNEWGLRDWMKTHGLFDYRIEMDKIIRDKFRNLIRIYRYAPNDDNSWQFTIPDGVIQSIGTGDPVGPGGTGTAGTDNAMPNVSIVMEKYLRHLSAMFMLDYDTNSSQECGNTGYSEWLDSELIFGDMEGVLRGSYYSKPSDQRLYHKIINNTIYLLNGDESEPFLIRLEYIKYPNEMTYDTDSSEFTYTIDLSEDQLEEVVDSCVRLYLERVQSQRYQSFLNEEKIRHR